MADRNVSVPLMHVFRAAFEAHDAKVRVDLRDEQGERVVAARRSRGRGSINEGALRREVAWDLDNLVNTVALGSSLDLSAYPNVAVSILNYGLPDIVHLSIEDAGVDNIAADLAHALKTYEPRLAKNSIVVQRDKTKGSAELMIRFTVRADLLSDPVNVPVEFIAGVVMDSGKIRLSRF